MQDLITKKVEEITANGKLDEIVTKEVTQAMQETVRNVLRSYGDVGKALEEKLKNDVMGGIEKLDFVQYAQTLTDLVQSSLNQSIVEYGVAPAKEAINKFVGALEKKEWKLSEIIEKFIESEVIEDDSHGESGEISFFVKKTDYGSTWIGFDKEEDKSSDYNCDYRLAINNKDKKLWLFSKESNKISPLTESNLHGFDLFLYKLYACKCTIEIDESNCETEWSTYD